MNTKLAIVATVAALSLATTAFAQGEGNGDPFPFSAPANAVTVTMARDTGSAQYPAFDPALSSTQLAQPTLPENGQNGSVETANSLPVNAFVGTVAYAHAQTVNRWFAQLDASRYAQRRLPRHNG